MTSNYYGTCGGRDATACSQSSQMSCDGQAATLPSLGVPVTESNRGLLRFLRAAELAAWEDAEGLL